MMPSKAVASKKYLTIFLLCCTLFLLNGIHGERAYWRSCDFIPLYGGARCMFSHCDPYKFADIARQYYGHGGKPIFTFSAWTEQPMNPPTTLAMVMPLALFSFPIASTIWTIASGVVFCWAAFAVLSFTRWTPMALAFTCLLLLTSPLLLMIGQSVTLAVGNVAIATVLMLRQRRPWLSTALMTFGIALKPHLVIVVLAYFLLEKRYRRRALAAAAAFTLLAIASCAWVTAQPSSRHWLEEVRITTANHVAPGGAGDPRTANPDGAAMVNFQTDSSLLTANIEHANFVAWGVALALTAGWLFAIRQAKPQRENDILAIAAICCITLLPVYHRMYDTRLLLLTVPALVLLLRNNRIVGIPLCVLTVLAFLSTNHLYASTLWRVDRHIGQRSEIFFGRQAPLVVATMAIIYVVSCWGRRLVPEGSITVVSNAMASQKDGVWR